MLDSRRMEGRRLGASRPFYRKKTHIASGIIASEEAVLDLPDGHAFEMQGIKITTDTEQTILGVYNRKKDVDAENLFIGPQAKAADVEYTLIGSATSDMEDLYGKPVQCQEKIVVDFKQETSAQSIVIEVWGRISKIKS